MQNIDDLKIFKRLFDFSKWLMNHSCCKFPKSHRFSVGVKLENTSLEVIELITRANMRRKKLNDLSEADEKLMFLKILIRLSYQMQFITLKSYQYGANELIEILRKLFRIKSMPPGKLIFERII